MFNDTKERGKFQHHTNETFMREVFKIIEGMPDFERAKGILDYMNPESNHVEKLTDCDFDVIAIPNFGGSEGIYVDCYIDGVYNESGKNGKLKAATLKTLGTSLEDMKAMGELCGIIEYVSRDYVNKNIRLFQPNIEVGNGQSVETQNRKTSSMEAEQPRGENTSGDLYLESQKEKSEAQRASEILSGAAAIPRGLDSNLPNADLDAVQEAVMSSIDKANAEVKDLRDSASRKEASASKGASAKAVAIAKDKLGQGAIVTNAQPGRTYSGKIIGVSGGTKSHPDTIAIQRISGNQAVLHKIKDIAAESNISVGAELSITKDKDGKTTVKTQAEIAREKEAQKGMGEERVL
ncbi:MAG: hypothetical protein LBO21_05655 [Synergistaceae bacterium]|jgi:hypothetical protein|nr:hypothetical protein [Synergistaceae bacterium]